MTVVPTDWLKSATDDVGETTGVTRDNEVAGNELGDETIREGIGGGVTEEVLCGTTTGEGVDGRTIGEVLGGRSTVEGVGGSTTGEVLGGTTASDVP